MNDEGPKRDQPDDTHPDACLTTTFAPDVDSVVDELITAVASADNTDPTEVEILANTIDPDALNTLVSSQSESQRRDSDLQVSFRYAGYVVCVDTDGTITLYPGDSRN